MDYVSLTLSETRNWFDRVREHSAVRAVALFAVASTIVYLSATFSREAGRVAAIWPMNAALLALLARQPRKSWQTLIAITWCANVCVNVLMGDDILRAVILSLANSVEVIICARLLFKPGTAFNISRTASLARFIVVAGIVGPVASAVIAASTLGSSSPILFGAVQWIIADGLGMLVFGPALLVLSLALAGPVARPRFRDLAIGSAVLLSALIIVFAQKSFPLLFCVPPALMFLTFRVGIIGAAGGIVTTALVAIGFTLGGLGPIQLVHGDQLSKLFTLQAFLAVISVTTLPLAAALAEARRTLAAKDEVNFQLRAAQQQAEHASAEAAISALRYKELTDYSTDILVRFGPGGVISHASPAVRMIGLTPEEAIGLTTSDLVVPEDMAFAKKVTAALFSGATPDPGIRREFRVRRPDGSILWLEGGPTILRDEQGRPTEVVSIFRDVTKRRELEDRLFEARKTAEAVTEAKAAFLAHMSHEIRTPLNSIIGFSRLLKDAGGLAPAVQRHAEIVNASSISLLALVNDVLDLSKFEAEAVEIESQPICLRDLINQACDEARVLSDAKGLTLNNEIAGDVAVTHLADGVRLRQVVLNLLNNAIKFTTAGEITVRLIAGATKAAKQSLRLEVQDTGIGISEEHLPLLFAPFAQSDSSIARRYGGTGLGLSIVREIATAMGGQCGVHSEIGRGSIFWFDLNLEIATSVTTEKDPQNSDRSIEPRHILVVDDVDLNRELAGLLLTGAGHHVDFAQGGSEAVRLAGAWPYDLIFMDVQMPGMDGLAATRAIRALAGAESIPIIAMTAQALPKQIAACLACGMNDYVAKPLAPNALNEMVKKWGSAGDNEKPSNAFDGAIGDLQRRFVERCAEDMAHIAALLAGAREIDDETRTRIHRLAGTAGTLGFADAGDISEALDKKLALGEVLNGTDFVPLLKALGALKAA